MATKNRMDRALNGPGPVEIVLSVVISLVLGILIGAVHLVFKPVEVVKKAEEATEVGSVYFVEGSANSSKSRQWTRKRQMLASGTPTEITLNEDELNAWTDSAIIAASSEAAKQGRKLRANFRIQDGVIHAGLIGSEGLPPTCWFQVKGTFVADNKSRKTFIAEEVYIGSLPLHSVIPGISTMFFEGVLNDKKTPEQVRTFWNRISSASVDGSLLRLTVE